MYYRKYISKIKIGWIVNISNSIESKVLDFEEDF